MLSHLKTFGCVSHVLDDSITRSKLDVKSIKCYFIGYGDEAFSYRFWDEQSRKIIRSKNVLFNEKARYKDKFGTDANTTPQHLEFVSSEDFPEVMVQHRDMIDDESGTSASIPIIPQSNSELSTSTTTIQRFTRTIRPPQHFSATLNYILLTDGGE
ncbi:uncharacterized protein LOC111380226 [Olea europaea var. sylvestris]|uniref:uncharacterized protein LOC111380226 n=1 Tax=Olea europaea var. sylvestris TaxID=158386 RepID=UPI000C1D4CE6|nr:uncharacterized protein LOC111380226 [Olea europaea var. sylvestris]